MRRMRVQIPPFIHTNSSVFEWISYWKCFICNVRNVHDAIARQNIDSKMSKCDENAKIIRLLRSERGFLLVCTFAYRFSVISRVKSFDMMERMLIDGKMIKLNQQIQVYKRISMKSYLRIQLMSQFNINSIISSTISNIPSYPYNWIIFEHFCVSFFIKFVNASPSSTKMTKNVNWNIVHRW